MAEVKTTTKLHQQIGVGDVVQGDTGVWWEVDHVTVQSDNFHQFDATNVDTGDAGYLSGPATQVRTVQVRNVRV